MTRQEISSFQLFTLAIISTLWTSANAQDPNDSLIIINEEPAEEVEEVSILTIPPAVIREPLSIDCQHLLHLAISTYRGKRSDATNVKQAKLEKYPMILSCEPDKLTLTINTANYHQLSPQMVYGGAGEVAALVNDFLLGEDHPDFTEESIEDYTKTLVAETYHMSINANGALTEVPAKWGGSYRQQSPSKNMIRIEMLYDIETTETP